MQIIRANQLLSKSWSGGKTTQLFIFPSKASYEERNFSFRLSTATVEVDSSNFSNLPGVFRTLMILDGEMKLIHKNHHFSHLQPLEQDQFKGDWNTQSEGQCVDFNLMCMKGVSGDIEGCAMTKNSSKKISGNADFNFIYLHLGEIEIDGETMGSGDFAHLNAGMILITALRQSTFVIAKIKC